MQSINLDDHNHAFGELLQAIVTDDVARAAVLILENPAVVGMRAQTAELILNGINHWFYAGDTALHLAAAGYRTEIAGHLLAAGGDPNVCGTHRNATPLHYAADGYIVDPHWDEDRQVKMLRFLLNAGANIHAQDKNGATPLHRAVRTRCAAAVTCLLDAGADPLVRNKPGSTPFHLAVQNTGRGGSGDSGAHEAQRRIILDFLARGVSIHLKDGKGKSVQDWARSEWIRKLLCA